MLSTIKLFEDENVPYPKLNELKQALAHEINIDTTIKTK